MTNFARAFYITQIPYTSNGITAWICNSSHIELWDVITDPCGFNPRPDLALGIDTQIARFMGPTWGPPVADRTQVGPMLAPWSLLTGVFASVFVCVHHCPDSKVHGANMGPTWGRQDPGGPHVGPMNLANRSFCVCLCVCPSLPW